jgi:uncharacterized RDD family membrane protein YckC
MLIVNEFKYETLSQRFFAAIIDGLILLPFVYFDELILVWTNPIWLLILWLPISHSVGWLYSVLLHGFYGQTLGKGICKIRVVDNVTEQPITMRQAFLRDGVIIVLNISLLILALYEVIGGESAEPAFFQETRGALDFIALIWASLEIITSLFNQKRRALHDFIAGTVVVRTDTA